MLLITNEGRITGNTRAFIENGFDFSTATYPLSSEYQSLVSCTLITTYSDISILI